MKLFEKSRKTVAKGLTVRVSNHYCPTLFGIRGHYESSYKSGQYVECGSPGTGFFVRTSSSHSYKNFCNAEKAKLTHSYWDMLRGKEFSFDEEISKANEALRDTNDETKARILEAYVNVLPLAKEAEEGERIIAGIKELGHRRHKLTTYQTHVISSYKSRIARLGHDVRDIQLSIPKLCSEERYNQFAEVVIAFTEVASSHRIWHSKDSYDTLDNAFEQVYFDLGIFDFIQAPLMTPLMRDSVGYYHFLFPDFWVATRSATDFDVYPLKDLTILSREVPYEMIANMVLSSYADLDESSSVHRHRDYEQYGSGLLVNKDTVATNEMEKENRMRERVVGELYIPELKLRYYVRDVRALKKFANALSKYKDTLVEN
ncbi:MAG: hypothetical protein IJK84_06645 [Bacteroidales bacterium]|nr:hypothetical protein [Bacteroidales bacterium]